MGTDPWFYLSSELNGRQESKVPISCIFLCIIRMAKALHGLVESGSGERGSEDAVRHFVILGLAGK